jgi:predicted Zn-dependent protease
MQNLRLRQEFSEQSQQIEKLKEQLNQQNNIADTAGKVIDWSAMIFGLFVIILGFAGWFAGNKFAKIDELKKELEDLLKGFKEQFTVEQNSISELKREFEKEKDASLKTLFPIIEGQWYSYQGDSDAAIERFKEVQKIIPEHPIVMSKLNKLLIYSGKIDEAIKNLESLTAKYPDDVKIKYILAEAYRRNGQLDIAENVIREVALTSNHPTSLYEYGTIKLRKKEFAVAEEILIKSHRSYTSEDGEPRVWVLTNLALAQLLQNKTDLSKVNITKSIEILKNRIQRTPKHQFFWANLGLALVVEQKSLAEAHEAFKKAVNFGLQVSLAQSYQERLELILEIRGDNKQIRSMIATLKECIEDNKLKSNEIANK